MADVPRKLIDTAITLVAIPPFLVLCWLACIGFALFVAFLIIEDLWQ